MTKEQLFFIQILSDHLNGRETKRIEDVDWDVIHQYAKMHQVNGIIYAQANTIMPQESRQLFQQEAFATIYCASNRDTDFNKIKNEMNDQGIQFFVIKGPAVAALFPEPKFRVMGDIDLVVKNQERELCHEILIKNGYECLSKQEDREWQYYKNKIELELHDRLVYIETVNEEGHEDFFNDCWKYVKDNQLDWNFHLLFLIFHLRKHFMNSGVGFRQFMDLAVVAQKIEIDWNWLKKYFKTTGMLQFAKTCYGFVERWFGLRTPIAETIPDDFYEEATRVIFHNGVFGFDNKENLISASVNEIRNSAFPRIRLLGQYMRGLFPSWKILSKTETFGYLKHNKLLLPIAWMHRWYRILKNGTVSKEKTTIRKTIASMQAYDRRMTWMKKWGLLSIDK